MKSNLDAEDIVKAIKAGGKPEQQALTQLYEENLNMIVGMILQRNGNEDDGHDMLQEAIIAFYERVKSGQYEPKSAISTFLYQVAGNLWNNKLKKKGHEVNFRIQNTEATELIHPADQLLERERCIMVLKLTRQLGEDCQKILRYSIYQELSMREICERMGFKNEQVARNKKSKCLNYLRKIIRDNSYFKGLIKERS